MDTNQNLKIKSIELALQLPDNTTHYNQPLQGMGMYQSTVQSTNKKTVDNLLIDAEKIFNYLNKQ